MEIRLPGKLALIFEQSGYGGLPCGGMWNRALRCRPPIGWVIRAQTVNLCPSPRTVSAVIHRQNDVLAETLVWLVVQGASCARPVRVLLKAKLLLLTPSSNSVLSPLPDPCVGSERDLPVTGNPKRQIPIMSELERALEMNFTFIQ